MGSDLHDGRRSCRPGCFHHVFKVPSVTHQQLPCSHTVFPSVRWGHQWFSGASSILPYLLSPGHLLLKVCPMPCPPFHMLALKSPAQPFHVALCITVHCPQKLSTSLFCSETSVASAAL